MELWSINRSYLAHSIYFDKAKIHVNNDDLQREISKEREHGRQVLIRIVSAIKFLAKHNIVF
jgi:hypothetical protein